MSFTDKFKQYQLDIENKLKGFLSQNDRKVDDPILDDSKNYEIIFDASRYSLLNTGKRIRPILLLEFYKLCGGKGDFAYNFACALEMIHSYSLVHDDLPCMDDDDFRRGKPSCHKQFGEDIALLAGDTLLTEAFLVALKTQNIPSERIVKAAAYLADCAGGNGMIGGQVMDITEKAFECLDFTLQMYAMKTGCLIKAATVCGAILAGANETQIKNARSYALKLGFAFQIIDDILDATGDEKVLGKPIGSDDKNGKLTYAKRLGLDKARQTAKKLTDEALEILNEFNGDTTFLKELTEFLLQRDY